MLTFYRKRKILSITLSIFALLVIGSGIYVYSIYNSVENTVEQIHEPITREKSEKRVEEVKFVERDPISILLLGVDERKNDRGRSDTIIVITVNPNDQSMRMVSIPRDTRTEIIGRGFDDKINHAYAYGGVEMAMDTVENFLDIPIDYFIKVNMESFKDIVDAVGGVTVNNDFAFNYSGYTFNEGEITLDGKAALAYSRMRYEDPRGDFGRQDRQKQIIQAVIEKGATFSTLSKFNNILAIIGDNIKTNLTFDDMVDIQANYKDARHSLEKLQVNGSGTMINGIYYLVVPEENRTTLSATLQEHLSIDSKNITAK